MTQKNFKNRITKSLLVLMLVAIAVGGTLAYLTDRDSEVNVFTLGNVQIDLIEDYKQGSELKPGIEVKKEAKIKNTGKSDAWVWMTIAVPSELDGTNSIARFLHWTGPVDASWITDAVNMQTSEIEGTDYNIYTILYASELAPGEETSLGLHKVSLDKNIDSVNNQYYWVTGGSATPINYDIAKAKIHVSAYAIQSEGFDTVMDAYNAFQTQWTDN